MRRTRRHRHTRARYGRSLVRRLYWRRVIRLDAFLGGLARLRSRLPWSRSPSTHTRLPEPEGVTCDDAGGPADTTLDIPGNVDAPGDAPLPLYTRLTAPF